MSIVIDDDDDDIICTTDESTIQFVYPDDKRLNDFIQAELDEKYSDFVADAYKKIFGHYSDTVVEQLQQKIELESKISAITIERTELKRQIDEMAKVFKEEERRIKSRNTAIDRAAADAIAQPVDMIPDESDSAAPTEDEVSQSTCGNRFELGSRLLVSVAADYWTVNGIDFKGITIDNDVHNAWEQQSSEQNPTKSSYNSSKKPIPQYFPGTLEEVEIAPEGKYSSFEFLDRCEYHVSLETEISGIEGRVGVKVSHDKIAYFGIEHKSKVGSWPFELGQNVVAPLKPIPITTDNVAPHIEAGF